MKKIFRQKCEARNFQWDAHIGIQDTRGKVRKKGKNVNMSEECYENRCYGWVSEWVESFERSNSRITES